MVTALDLAGMQIGRYRVVALLGSGGMGAVYDAIDPTLGRHVALKILPATAANAGRLDRFIKEAKAASALNHPHLVSIYEIGSSQSDGTPIHFIAMEKIDGKTLREILSREALPLRKTLEIMAQVSDAVAAAHSVGVIHRDLKPENIMMSSAGYAKVLDFGLAKLRPDLDAGSGEDDPTAVRSTETGVVLGTAGYMSPEQAQGKEADHRTDIFALGCTLYELVSGKRAFRGDSSVDTLHKIIYSEPQPLTEVVANAPAELQRIVRKAIAKDPDERYQSAKDLAVDLRALLREVTSGVGRTQRRRVSIALAVAAFLIVVGVIVQWRGTSGARTRPAMTFQRVTARGDVVDAQISPDGRFVAFAVREEQGGTLWLKQLATGEELQLVPRMVGAFWGFTFTPDGSALIYGIKTPREPRGALYRISTIGGHPQHLADGVDSNVTFSPDGKRIAWYRADFPKSGESSLMIANSDGTGEHVVAARQPPELFAPQFFTHPSWSPDGKLIAAAVRRTQDPVGAKLIGFDPESGRETLISDARWFAMTVVEWLPEGTGIVAIASHDTESTDPLTLAPVQMWLIPYPSGEPRLLTNDPVMYYRDPSVCADGSKLVAVAVDTKVHLSRAPIFSSEPAAKISSGRYDGVTGVCELRDGRIVFSAAERGTNTTLWIMERDGTGRRLLLHDSYRNRYPVAFSDGIAYVSTTPTETDVCVVDDDGEARRVIARKVDDAPIGISPDGKWLVYSLNRRLWKISTAGGQPRQLAPDIASNPSYSPTGDRIAFMTGDWQHPEGNQLVVTTAEGDKVLWSETVQRQSGTLRWAPDGRALLLLNFDTHNIWIYPMHGKPRQFTNFEDMVWSFDIAPDGKSVVVGEGSIARDAVLITGFH